MMNRKISIIWFIPIVILSAIFGFYTNSYSFFIFKNEIDIISLLTLIITSFFGLYLAYNVPKNIDANKFEKELMYEILKPLNAKIRIFLGEIKSRQFPFNNTVKDFKEISSLLTELEELNDASSIIDCKKKVDLIRKELFETKKIITNSNLEDDFFKVESNNVIVSTTLMKSIKRKAVELIVEVNRC